MYFFKPEVETVKRKQRLRYDKVFHHLGQRSPPKTEYDY